MKDGSQRLRSSKTQAVHSSLRSGRGHHSDQGQVWDDIRIFNFKSAVTSLIEIFKGCIICLCKTLGHLLTGP